MTADAREAAFQDDIIQQMLAGGWVLGSPYKYDRERALYPADCLAYVKATQAKEWAKYEGLYPGKAEQAFLDKLTSQLAKADPLATDMHLRSFGTLGVLRHGFRDRSATFDLCQFKPEHDLNPETQARYEQNILRVVPEVTYSPYATDAHMAEHGTQAKKWRIDLVLFLNGLPIVTLELKSEFKQAVNNAIKQYKTTRLPIDKDTRKPEPLLTFKRGALVHFAVSQYEAYMTTKLAGADTRFLPFNKGTKDGAAGNDVPEDENEYATGYLWNEVLARENLLQIIGFIHLQIEEVEDFEGRKSKKESLIFPRYHQWDLVRKLLAASLAEGPGQRYLAQHSAGSGKSNSIAWAAHQLSQLYRDGKKLFDSVIVVTDRTVLDDQLQDTIYQFEHAEGVVGRINRDEGQGSKSEKLAAALVKSQPIVIVTIQTFPFVLKAIEDNVSLKERCYAIIADEAHSSQSGSTAAKLKMVLASGESGEDGEGASTEDLLVAQVAARRSSGNISYYAFTATPKSKTLELFGRRPNPDEPSSKTNKPLAFHVYSMRQAIEEGYILDVLQNYTSYKVAYQLSQKAGKADTEVESKKAKAKLGQWVKLHEHNIAQKVKVIVEHYRDNVMALLGGQAKAMVVTGSRKEAVRYKLAFDQYISKQGYGINAMVAFSGEVAFNEEDPNAEALLGEKFTETGMNPGLKGRDMREAFDGDDFNVMIVAQKFQTGFDQPKLCAMYVDKKLGGIECVQTLSRLNRMYPGKAETYVLDFFNEPAEVLEAFQEYYQTAALLDVSDPDIIWDLYDKLRAQDVFLWTEVERFCEVFFKKNATPANISHTCQEPKQRWQNRLTEARAEFTKQKELFERAEKLGDAVFMANTETDMNDAKKVVDELWMLKSDLASLTRYYEFMSQIVDYDSTDLEKLSLFARHLGPMLRDKNPEDEEGIDLSSVDLSHYRLAKIREQDLKLKKNQDGGLEPANDLGTGKAKSKQEEWLSQIITRLNEIFTGEVTESDMLNYAYTIRDKVRENKVVMQQVSNNSASQALLGDYPAAVDEAVMESADAHQQQMMQYLNDPRVQEGFRQVVFDLLSTSDSARM